MRKIEKPWGYELIWAETDRYVGKILHIVKGSSLSLQYHKVKDETVLVQSGILTLKLDKETFRLSSGESKRVPVGSIHRMSALDGDVDVIEVSTPELDDVVRLEDMYGRT